MVFLSSSTSLLLLLFLQFFKLFFCNSYYSCFTWMKVDFLFLVLLSEQLRWIHLGDFFSFLENPFKLQNVSRLYFFFYFSVVHGFADLQICFCFTENLKKGLEIFGPGLCKIEVWSYFLRSRLRQICILGPTRKFLSGSDPGKMIAGLEPIPALSSPRGEPENYPYETFYSPTSFFFNHNNNFKWLS